MPHYILTDFKAATGDIYQHIYNTLTHTFENL